MLVVSGAGRGNKPLNASVSPKMGTLFTAGLAGMLALGMAGITMAQENAPQRQGPNQTRHGMHGPRSIDQELDHLTKDLELTRNQCKQIRPPLEEHHDRIQAL